MLGHMGLGNCSAQYYAVCTVRTRSVHGVDRVERHSAKERQCESFPWECCIWWWTVSGSCSALHARISLGASLAASATPDRFDIVFDFRKRHCLVCDLVDAVARHLVDTASFVGFMFPRGLYSSKWLEAFL
ncbi:hypothetical protein KC19_9G181800 [Ceratodon purpureus]|uniref:Uncharacterized protein n=1 Tax=Ceratodon purpureus TaxID=3225 RepID=A0A8T0GWI8_CERPU|nr:hypothetical protein KC19_9G181800 [Ceratodon purpureus]